MNAHEQAAATAATTSTTTPTTSAPTFGAFTGQPEAVNAVQWDGTPEALQRLQALLWPGSPLIATPGLEPRTKEKSTTYGNPATAHVGVHVTAPDQHYIGHELKFANVGDWVLRFDDGRIEIVTGSAFARRFTPAAAAIDPRD